MSVSELRFNLPGSSVPPTPRGEESSKRSSFFHRGRHSRNNSSLSVNRDEKEEARNSLDRLDLSLGQELAGGGFGGKQAKLGKIIVEDEGGGGHTKRLFSHHEATVEASRPSQPRRVPCNDYGRPESLNSGRTTPLNVEIPKAQLEIAVICPKVTLLFCRIRTCT
jgi:hypothetical protein